MYYPSLGINLSSSCDHRVPTCPGKPENVLENIVPVKNPLRTLKPMNKYYASRRKIRL